MEEKLDDGIMKMLRCANSPKAYLMSIALAILISVFLTTFSCAPITPTPIDADALILATILIGADNACYSSLPYWDAAAAVVQQSQCNYYQMQQLVNQLNVNQFIQQQNMILQLRHTGFLH
jgi:hypothetical protein